MRIFHHQSHSGTLWNTTLWILCIAGVSVATASTMLALSSGEPWLRFPLLLLAIMGIFATCCLLYARFVEPLWIIVTKRSVPFPTRNALRIAVIGDFHVHEKGDERFIAKAVDYCNAQTPDLVLLVGDFLCDHQSDIRPLAALKHVQARHGVFAVVGNHDSSKHHLPGKDALHHGHPDRSDELERLLEPLGITFLRNRSITIEHDGETVCIAGIDDLWMESCNLHKALEDSTHDMPTILLSHNPDIILDPQSHTASLIVSGHTHGGQVRLPWLGPICALPQRLNKKFDRGIFAVSPTCSLAVTHGIGETHIPLRFCARPEILLLTTHLPRAGKMPHE